MYVMFADVSILVIVFAIKTPQTNVNALSSNFNDMPLLFLDVFNNIHCNQYFYTQLYMYCMCMNLICDRTASLSDWIPE